MGYLRIWKSKNLQSQFLENFQNQRTCTGLQLFEKNYKKSRTFQKPAKNPGPFYQNNWQRTSSYIVYSHWFLDFLRTVVVFQNQFSDFLKLQLYIRTIIFLFFENCSYYICLRTSCYQFPFLITTQSATLPDHFFVLPLIPI